jgi:hypothetical protein
MESLLEKTLIILAEFNDDYDYIPLTRGFIGDYFEHLQQGLSEIDGREEDDRTRLLATALEILTVVRAERAKLQDDIGGNLRVAMIDRLMGDIRSYGGPEDRKERESQPPIAA